MLSCLDNPSAQLLPQLQHSCDPLTQIGVDLSSILHPSGSGKYQLFQDSPTQHSASSDSLWDMKDKRLCSEPQGAFPLSTLMQEHQAEPSVAQPVFQSDAWMQNAVQQQQQEALISHVYSLSQQYQQQLQQAQLLESLQTLQAQVLAQLLQQQCAQQQQPQFQRSNAQGQYFAAASTNQQGYQQNQPNVSPEVEARIIMARIRNCTSLGILEGILKQNYKRMDNDHLCLATWRMAQLAKKATAYHKAKVYARRLVRSFIMPEFLQRAQGLTPRQLSTMYWALSRLGAAKQFYHQITDVVGQEILKRIHEFNPVDYSMMIQSWSSMRNPIPQVGECLLNNAPRFIPELDQQSLGHVAFAVGVMLPRDARAHEVLRQVVDHLRPMEAVLTLDSISLFLMGAARVGYCDTAFVRTAIQRYSGGLQVADFNQLEHMLYFCGRMGYPLPGHILQGCNARLAQLTPRLKVEEFHRLLFALSLFPAEQLAESAQEVRRAIATQAPIIFRSGEWSAERRVQIIGCMKSLRMDTAALEQLMLQGGEAFEQAWARMPHLVDPVDMGLEKPSAAEHAE